MPNIDILTKYKNIHMIGIGGVSMSGIAAILKNFGFHVTGSDANDSDSIKLLKDKGIKVTVGHNLEDISKADVVVYSAAIKQDDPEMLEAKKLNIETIERADFLGILTRCFKDTICISGTHGKTTTTSMVSLCFIEALKDPSIQVGAFLKAINGNYKVGNSENEPYTSNKKPTINPPTIFFVHLSPTFLYLNPSMIDNIGIGNQHQNAHIFLVKFKPCCGLISSTNDTDHKAPNKLHIVTINNIIIKILINLIFLVFSFSINYLHFYKLF